MKNRKNTVIAVLAALVVVLGVLLIITNTDKGKLAEANNGLTAQVESLSGEKTNLESQVESLSGEKANLEGQVESLSGEKTNLESQVESLSGEKANLEGQVESLSGEKANLEGQVESLSGEKTNLESQVESLSGEKANLEGQVESLSGEKANLEGQVTSLKEEAARTAETTKAELEKAAGETAAAQAQLDEAVKAKEEAEAALQAARETSGTAQAAGEIDYAAVFPSWNPDSASLKELVDFVSASVDESGAGYIAPADRLAVFDMDGTIICEKAPIYIDSCLTMYRVLDDPTYSATEEERAAMQELRDHAYATGENYHPETFTKDDLIASAFAEMTPAQFHAYVVNFADHVDAVGFSGMTYGESFYKPMLEVIDFLRANGYDVWMVSACEREVVRGIVERLGFSYDHVIGTDVVYAASGSGDTVADEYNMGQDEQIVLRGPLNEVETGKSGKPAAIAREIGKRPVLAFGNSSGDYSMLNYAEGNPEHKGMGILVVCDDTVREYGSETKAADFYAEVEKQNWTAFSMANDWRTIYGDGVEKTGLPGAQTPSEAAAESGTAPAAEAATPEQPLTETGDAPNGDAEEEQELAPAA